jgi:hypothetical protein
MKISRITLNTPDDDDGLEHIEVGAPLFYAGEEEIPLIVKEIKYLESSQVYNKFIHEPIYTVEVENAQFKLVIPVRSVKYITIDNKKEVAVLPIPENLGD